MRSPSCLSRYIDASGCEKFLESGAPDMPATLDAILDAELAERGGVT